MNARSLVVGVLLTGWVQLASAPIVEGQDAVDQWKRWEKTIQSTRDYTLSGGNPYKDLILRVEFTNGSTGQQFVQDAFWEGLFASPRSFKVRSAFPPGNWSWRVLSCQGTTGGQNCATDSGWTPASGTITVRAVTTTTIRLYDRGFPKQYVIKSGGFVSSYSSLFYYTDEIFFWVGDTAWAAPPREISAQTATWSTFLTDRKGKGFTSVLLAPAVAWKPKAGETWTPLPDAAGFSFTQAGSCSAPIPNDCSRPRPEYWNAFDNLVKQANDKDILVVIAGVIDPVRLADNGTYPNLQNAMDFARYIAARMAGSSVIFSPGFDDKIDSRTFDGASTVAQVMNAVGPALKAAAPRHLVTNHLGGGSTCPDYQFFQSFGWMTFYLFQSGHAFSQNGVAGTYCPGRLNTETQLQAALRRAREMPLALEGYLSPYMPNLNGEGPYDKYPVTTDEVDNRYRVRQAGYVSSLSDAKGFTYGATNLGVWYQPGTLFGLSSSADMRQLANRFRGRSNLKAWHNWILNQFPDPDHDKKLVLASDGSSLVLAYIPGGSRSQIVIDTTYFSDLKCGAAWSVKWYDPPTGVASSGSCSQGLNQITLPRPVCISGSDCDWLLEIQKTGSGFSSGSQIAATERLTLWSETSLGDGSSAIYGEIVGPGRSTESRPIPISPAGLSFQQAPRVVRLGADYFVVWQSEKLDGSLNGVFGRILQRDGETVGPIFQINSFTEHDQRDPALAADPSGPAMVAWSSYGQDGDRGGIFGRLFDRFGAPLGEEMRINSVEEGHQVTPLILNDFAGGFVVAWSTAQQEDGVSAISFRRFNREGKPLTDEVRIPGGAASLVRLLDLQISPLGRILLRWEAQATWGRSGAQLRQEFDFGGRPLGPATQIFSGDGDSE